MESRNYFDEIAPQWDRLRESFFSKAVRDKALSVANVHPGPLNSLLKVGQALSSCQPVALPENPLRSLSPGVTDSDPLADFYVAVLTEGSALGDKTILFRHISAARLTFNSTFLSHVYYT